MKYFWPRFWLVVTFVFGIAAVLEQSVRLLAAEIISVIAMGLSFPNDDQDQ